MEDIAGLHSMVLGFEESRFAVRWCYREDGRYDHRNAKCKSPKQHVRSDTKRQERYRRGGVRYLSSGHATALWRADVRSAKGEEDCYTVSLGMMVDCGS